MGCSFSGDTGKNCWGFLLCAFKMAFVPPCLDHRNLRTGPKYVHSLGVEHVEAIGEVEDLDGNTP